MDFGDSSSSPENLAMLNSGMAEMSQCSGLGGHVPSSQLIRGYFSGGRDGLQGLCECVFVYVGACVHNKTCLPPSKRKGPTCSSGYPDRHRLRPLLPRPPVSVVELKGYTHSETGLTMETILSGQAWGEV